MPWLLTQKRKCVRVTKSKSTFCGRHLKDIFLMRFFGGKKSSSAIALATAGSISSDNTQKTLTDETMAKVKKVPHANPLFKRGVLLQADFRKLLHVSLCGINRSCRPNNCLFHTNRHIDGAKNLLKRLTHQADPSKNTGKH